MAGRQHEVRPGAYGRARSVAPRAGGGGELRDVGIRFPRTASVARAPQLRLTAEHAMEQPGVYGILNHFPWHLRRLKVRPSRSAVACKEKPLALNPPGYHPVAPVVGDYPDVPAIGTIHHHVAGIDILEAERAPRKAEVVRPLRTCPGRRSYDRLRGIGMAHDDESVAARVVVPLKPPLEHKLERLSRVIASVDTRLGAPCRAGGDKERILLRGMSEHPAYLVRRLVAGRKCAMQHGPARAAVVAPVAPVHVGGHVEPVRIARGERHVLQIPSSADSRRAPRPVPRNVRTGRGRNGRA